MKNKVEMAETKQRENLLHSFLDQGGTIQRQEAEKVVQDFYDFFDSPINNICAEDIYAYASHMRETNITEEQWKLVFDILGSFFEFALNMSYILRNPMKPLERGIPKCLGASGSQGSGEMVFTSVGMMKPVLAEAVPDLSKNRDILRALYFPYARSFDPSFLKASLLLYDELWFLDPLDRVARSEICHYRDDGLVDSQSWGRFIEIYDKLFDAGFIKIYNDFSLYREYDKLLSYTLVADQQDHTFVSKVNQELTTNGWAIHKARLPIRHYWKLNAINSIRNGSLA